MSFSQPFLLQRRLAAEAVLREAGKRAQQRFVSRAFEIEEKGIQDFVSEVDRQTEAFIRESLTTLFPDDTVLGEENGGTVGNRAWIVDPIDGTTNFVRGIPFWCLSAGLVIDGVPAVGVIYDPCRDEMFCAHKGGGTMLNGMAVRTSSTSDPTRAILSVGFNFKAPVERHLSVLAGLFAAGAVYRMPGAGALALAHVAAGRFDGFWEAFIHPWDVAAGLVLVTEAGGIVSDYPLNDGLHTGSPILASTPGMAEFFTALTCGAVEGG
ncbi:inositol monophosphatase family protein [Devosia nitrariae]|uniref:Inositol-1-monophosphatase n=1 Tax=Devosia nitrariae TaxID=2071872 RepID=A0ABQ5VZ15_9HYPH|nr:inositol monophosphatase family protein [Devosia nitrariae]GLQ52896.1 inositol monophosphatase [Devosia nitrariae]